MRISDWSSDVCSSDLALSQSGRLCAFCRLTLRRRLVLALLAIRALFVAEPVPAFGVAGRTALHTIPLDPPQSLERRCLLARTLLQLFDQLLPIVRPPAGAASRPGEERKNGCEGKSVSVRVD